MSHTYLSLEKSKTHSTQSHEFIRFHVNVIHVHAHFHDRIDCYLMSSPCKEDCLQKVVFVYPSPNCLSHLQIANTSGKM